MKAKRLHMPFSQRAEVWRPKRLLSWLICLFTVAAVHAQVMDELYYYFDNDPQSVVNVTLPSTPDADVTFMVTTSSLSPGLHFLNIYASDSDGRLSHVNRKLFMHQPWMDPSIIGVEYFIDTDPGEGSAIPVSIVPGTDLQQVFFEISTDSLDFGIHHLFIRGRDAAGKWSIVNHKLIICQPGILPDIVKAEYFLDTDPGEGSASQIPLVAGQDLTNLAFEIDMTSVTPGMHHLFIRGKDANGKWSQLNHKLIICQPGIPPDIVKAEYFTGADPGAGMGTDIPVVPGTDINNLVFTMDLSIYAPGNHTLFLRAKDTYGKWSITNITSFEVVQLSHNLNLVVFLEGLYAGNALMVQANDENGPHFGEGIADQVTVELHSASNYTDIVYSSGPVDLQTNGHLSLTGISAGIGGSYYITIRHRNSIETTTAGPVSFSGTEISYNFSTSASQAYGDNQKDTGGVFAIWGGDVNQDGIVDGGDMNPVDNAATAITFGYVPEDVNGDGIVDGGDMNTVDNNSTAIIMALIP